jgi:putative endonuclease
MPSRTGVRDLLFGLRMSHIYCVYTSASRSRNLYTGVTDNLERRMMEHREGLVPGFTVQYRIFRLVHFEEFGDIGCAIAREKEIKGWRREKKVWMIERKNPTWVDLAEGLPGKGQMDKREADVHHRAKAATSKADPSPPVRRKAGDRVRDDRRGHPRKGTTIRVLRLGGPEEAEVGGYAGEVLVAGG